MPQVQKAMGSSSLVEVIDRILDKGLVIDAWVRFSLVGIELLSIEGRIVASSVETIYMGNKRRTILGIDRVQKRVANRFKSIIPPKTFTDKSQEEEHLFLKELAEEVKSGKKVHRVSEAKTDVSKRRDELREWTKHRPTIIPKRVLSLVSEAKNKILNKEKSEKNNNKRRKKAA